MSTPHERIFDTAPPDELLFSISADGHRRYIHPVVSKGRYWKIRRNIAVALVVLFFVGDSLPWIAFAFLLFRLFDIVKPPPIRAVDAALKSGFGVMVDDLLAAGCTLLVLALARRVLG